MKNHLSRRNFFKKSMGYSASVYVGTKLKTSSTKSEKLWNIVWDLREQYPQGFEKTFFDDEKNRILHTRDLSILRIGIDNIMYQVQVYQEKSFDLFIRPRGDYGIDKNMIFFKEGNLDDKYDEYKICGGKRLKEILQALNVEVPESILSLGRGYIIDPRLEGKESYIKTLNSNRNKENKIISCRKAHDQEEKSIQSLYISSLDNLLDLDIIILPK